MQAAAAQASVARLSRTPFAGGALRVFTCMGTTIIHHRLRTYDPRNPRTDDMFAFPPSEGSTLFLPIPGSTCTNARSSVEFTLSAACVGLQTQARLGCRLDKMF